MIDSQAIAMIPEPTQRDMVMQALVTLSRSKVFLNQIEIEKEKLLEGNSEQNPEELAKQILDYRRRTQQLATMHQLGLNMMKGR